MNDTEKLLIERACERLVSEYCHVIDHGQAERVADLFCDDGVWSGPGVTMEGREQLRKGFAQRQAQRGRMSRHVCNNLLVNVIDEQNAEATVYLTLFRHDGDEGRAVSPMQGQPELVGEYRDRFRKTADGWRFARRETHVSFFRQPEAKS